MPRKTSSVGVLQKFITSNQNTVGFSGSGGGGGNSALVQKLQSYIDVNVKPYFITDYLNNDTSDLDNYILNNYTNVLTNLNKYLSDTDTSYLAAIGISILQITAKGRSEGKIMHEKISKYLVAREAPEVIRAVVEADVSLDVRYLLYIQKYGVPPGGVFDPVLLAEFDGYDN